MSRPRDAADSEPRTRVLVKERAILIYGDDIPLWMDTVEPLCEHCGQRRITDMHHRLFRSHGGLWTPSNIVGLCVLCHNATTVEPQWGYERGLNIANGDDPLTRSVQLWYSPHRVLLDDLGKYTLDIA